MVVVVVVVVVVVAAVVECRAKEPSKVPHERPGKKRADVPVRVEALTLESGWRLPSHPLLFQRES